MPDDMWDTFDATVRRAEPELDRSKVIREFVRWYIGETDDLPRRPVATPMRQYTFAQWPDALPWLRASFPQWKRMAAEIAAAAMGFADHEYVGVATWLALTGPARGREDVRRRILRDLLSAAQAVPARAGWRARYRDTDELGGQIGAALDTHLPPDPISAY
jgi:hypothetical protein